MNETELRQARRRGTVTNAVDLAGAALIVTGVAFIFWPAALILAGVALLFASWRAS